MAGEVLSIPIERIQLYEENPRHKKITEPDKIIKYLLQDEQVFELAKSIAEHKTNPLELIGVVRTDDKNDSGDPTYEVWEGNRRVCAMMLLNDPDKAFGKWKKRFEELSQDVDEIKTVDGRVFEDHNELRFWMRNIHNGAQGGRGRKDWGPDEQHRDNPTKKNAIAFDLLENAEKEGLITSTQRSGSLTTLQRYVEKPDMRAIFQADDTDPANVKFGRSKSDLKKLTKKIVEDLASKAISSRKNEEQVKDYAKTFESEAGVKPFEVSGSSSKHSVDDESFDKSDEKESDKKSSSKPATKIRRDRKLIESIANSGSDKLENLYFSITTINAKTRPQLVAVGVWALLETCARICGASEKTAFNHFFSTGLMGKMGVTKRAAGATHKALERLAEGGNTTKHDAISGSFNHRQIINDMDRVSSMIAMALDSAAD